MYDSVELEQSLTIHATNEVVLAAGTIGTPQLLQLSGIGDSDVLSGLGIESAVNLPDVGKNLQDHPMAVVYLQVNSTKGWDDVTRNDTVFNDYLQEWEASREGLFVNSPANTLAFMRLPSDASIFEQYSDPSPDECSAHTELIFVVCTYDLSCIRYLAGTLSLSLGWVCDIRCRFPTFCRELYHSPNGGGFSFVPYVQAH